MVKDDAMPNSFVAVLAREVGVALQGRILWAWRYKVELCGRGVTRSNSVGVALQDRILWAWRYKVELCGRGVKGRIINRFQRDLKKKFIVLTIY